MILREIHYEDGQKIITESEIKEPEYLIQGHRGDYYYDFEVILDLETGEKKTIQTRTKVDYD